MKAFMPSTILRAIAVAGLMLLGSAVQATPINLVKNGGFESSTKGTGQIDHNTVVTGWSSPRGYNFLFEPGTADTTGVKTWFNGPLDSILHLWGANNGGANALAVSANGGNFVAADGVYGVVPIQQAITGMVVGQTYMLSFEWAAAQQARFHGVTTEQWTVTIDGNTFATATYQNKSHASSNWMQEAFYFTAKQSDSVLSFLAAGTPQGFPPFSLLDGVSLTAVDGSQGNPVSEPGSWLTMMSGIVLLGMVLRRRSAAKR
jgi:hypothetical protein